MLSDAQLACLLPACAALGVTAIFAAADLIERAIAGHALRLARRGRP